ncbi:MAG: hypothetical protein US36_C0004G0012 [Candidatus Wolfebacteria bacterium GW2011_GWC1_37_10]|uniref:O-antigen ligase-related domain-containing protein n=1 Tax=Candidatus Wolfebacteria bacterium GW2011_GWC1_37_10 TaxID=1619010 RepID=A0A0G0J4I5_9BACT|nr:MAG: hypothetical protein US36_C0004G0012 [Candidatus Wolfebacteria bacterium GW2011_GWC1_37_10]
MKLTKFFIFAVAFTPLLYKQNIIYPYLTGKLFFLRFVIELALISFIAYKALSINSFEEFKKDLRSFFGVYGKNILLLALLAFVVSMAVSTIFAINPYRAFWGNLERAEGLINFFHYLILSLLMIVLFSRSDWLKFFTISLGVGMISIFYGFLQAFGMMNFPFMPHGGDIKRVGSFIGNSAFFSAYLMLVIAVAGIVVGFISKRWLKGLVYLVMAISLGMIFLTRTRGAIIGLGAGIFVLLIYFAFKKQKLTNPEADASHRYGAGLQTYKLINRRAISIILLSLIIIFGSVFWFTKNNDVWQKIPGFDRLAKTAFINSNDASVQTRLIAWRSSLEAFKEKPFIGWGLEGYLTAYSKYYDPAYAVYGETWLDRAHNKIIDVAVMQGIFGILAYLALWGLLLAAFWRQPLVLAALVAYFIQNFFVFEEINSYALFYPLLGFAIASWANRSKPEESPKKEIKINPPTHYLQLSVAGISVFAVLIFAYFYNYIPYVQAKNANLIYNAQATSGNQEALLQELQNIFYPYNFAQSSIRTTLTDRFYEAKSDNRFVFENPELQLLAQSLENAVDELIAFEPLYDPRFYIRKNQISFSRAKISDSLKFYQQAESASREALKMAPQRQEVYYGLAFALAGQNRVEEAIQAAQSAVELQPNVARAYYHLGLMRAISKNKTEALKAFEIMFKLSPDLSGLFSSDATGLIVSYKILGAFDKLGDLVIKRIEGKIIISISQDDYLLTLKYFTDQRDAENFIKVASYLAQFSNLKDDMEILIDLAKNGNWDIINSL